MDMITNCFADRLKIAGGLIRHRRTGTARPRRRAYAMFWACEKAAKSAALRAPLRQ